MSSDAVAGASPAAESAPRRRWRGPSVRLWFGVLLVLGYVGLSWAVRFDTRLAPHNASLVYPLDTFSMYAADADPAVSYVVAEEPDGVVRDVTAYRSFDCVPEASAAACRDDSIPYIENQAMAYVRLHPGPGTHPVVLARRTWRIQPLAAPASAPDCVLARCEAAR